MNAKLFFKKGSRVKKSLTFQIRCQLKWYEFFNPVIRERELLSLNEVRGKPLRRGRWGGQLNRWEYNKSSASIEEGSR